ncbi:Rha family transcriptional regulator [Limosilactobacillus oris]|uniref:Rha family transcriptional regulator n=1 Tax=Limosilactobacillus oris TaxID=1632 RepID=UPI0024BA94E6|nr:Rha family transcriptional regulator [Limosilactobacillus oris]
MTEKIIEAAAKKHDLAGLADLVFMHGLNEEPYTTDKIIAENSGNDLDSVRRLARSHKQDFEEFGFFGFEIRKLSGRGRPEKIYHFNEQQATLLITYLDNTPQVNQFKKCLVREFYRMKKELTTRQINRAIEKPQRKTLMDAVKSWPNANQWSYRNMTQLLLKRATGLTANQIKQQRHVNNSLDGLTVKEQERYKQLENIAIGLVSLNKTWDEVKGVLLLA